MRTLAAIGISLLAAGAAAAAIPTENHGLPVLPAPAGIAVDGDPSDWDLSHTIFVCSDVTRHTDSYAVRIGAMYDAQYLYVLAYWYDRTPMNNPGQVSADYGWLGDCLQLRLMTGDLKAGLVTHVTAWRGVTGADVVDLTYGRDFQGGQVKNAGERGALQSFKAWDDPSTSSGQAVGYTQELALPWALITSDQSPLKAGDIMAIGVEANFTLENGSRLTVKGNFNPNEQIDRIFTYTKPPVWGPATLVDRPPAEPLPVRLADGRIFPTTMKDGRPAVDWSGLAVDEPRADTLKSFTFEIPADGFLSTIIKDSSGHIVRHLLSALPVGKGNETFHWDGLSTPNHDEKGTPVPVGNYTVHSLFHPEYDILFRGWAGSSAQIPWENGPTTNWGGDHGPPTAVAAGQDGVFLGWFKSESGRPLVACDLDGRVLWRKKFGGMSGVKALATAGDTLYVLGGASRGLAAQGGSVFKIEQATGLYRNWAGSDDAELKISDHPPAADAQTADGIAAANGKFYLGFGKANKVVAYDAESGKLLASYDVHNPTSLAATADGTIHVLSDGSARVLQPGGDAFARSPLGDLDNARALAIGADDEIYVGLGEPANQVHVYRPDGRMLRRIGRQGGRALTGPWNPDGMRFIAAVAVDRAGQLWVAEQDDHPRRFSRWDAATGAFTGEFFGPAHYGAIGAAINPVEPNKMIGQSAEWEIDPATQTFRCLGVVTRENTANSMYILAPNDRLYLVTATEWRAGDIDIFERVGDGQFARRASFTYEGKRQFGQGREIDAALPQKTHYWADRNGDGREQDDEVTTVDRIIHFNPWNIHVWPDFTIYAGTEAYPLQGFTECGAPRFDIANPQLLPAAGVGSVNSDVMLTYSRQDWGATHSWYTAYDRTTGDELWRYPNNFVGVHGSHKAPPFPQPGLIRGSYGPMNCVTLPDPIGNAWFLTTNLGEWHVLTEEGFYLARLFNGDYLDWAWPEKPVRGANMNRAPSGGGGEDFGGYVTVGVDGKVYAQSGHTAYWNLEITGLEKTRRLPVQAVTISKEDFQQAAVIAQKMDEKKDERKSYPLQRHTPGAFYANLNADFKDQQREMFARKNTARVFFAASYDETYLYLGWEVQDRTPWVNGAEQPEHMYARGDTVDFQMGTVPLPDRKGGEAMAGDLRLSIGNLQGTPTAVIYRKVSDTKKPQSFSSGVIADYPMDYVAVAPEVKIQVKIRGDTYWVQAAVPWTTLGITPKPGRSFPADLGVTYGDGAGTDTILRTYWNNRNTGLVNDEVFELKMTPRNWGVFDVQ